MYIVFRNLGPEVWESLGIHSRCVMLDKLVLPMGLFLLGKLGLTVLASAFYSLKEIPLEVLCMVCKEGIHILATC